MNRISRIESNYQEYAEIKRISEQVFVFFLILFILSIPV